MAKPTTVDIRLNSTAETGHFYVTKKNARTMTDKMVVRKYDPVARKHVEYKEGRSSDPALNARIGDRNDTRPPRARGGRCCLMAPLAGFGVAGNRSEDRNGARPPEEDSVRVAAAAYPIDWHNRWNDYVGKLRVWVRTACEGGAQILVFPEFAALEVATLAEAENAGDPGGRSRRCARG